MLSFCRFYFSKMRIFRIGSFGAGRGSKGYLAAGNRSACRAYIPPSLEWSSSSMEEYPNTGEVVGPQGTGTCEPAGWLGSRYDRHVYAVTCHHVAPRGASIIRINTNDWPGCWLEFEPHNGNS